MSSDMLNIESACRFFLRQYDAIFFPNEVPDESSWSFSKFPKFQEGVAYYEPLRHVFDSAIYVLNCIDFDLHDVPLIFLRNSIERTRMLTANSILKGSFPL